MEQKKAMCGQNVGILRRKSRCVYSLAHNLDLNINTISVLFALEESVGLSQSKLRNE
jgi:hypothetical protein